MCEHAEISFEDPRSLRQSKNKGLPKLRDGAKERTASFTQKYRFGFNNQEQETELGEYYSFEYRVHDARLGRFLSVDPWEAKFTTLTNYGFTSNNPINKFELDGRTDYYSTDMKYLGSDGTTKTDIIILTDSDIAKEWLKIVKQSKDKDYVELESEELKQLNTNNSVVLPRYSERSEIIDIINKDPLTTGPFKENDRVHEVAGSVYRELRVENGDVTQEENESGKSAVFSALGKEYKAIDVVKGFFNNEETLQADFGKIINTADFVGRTKYRWHTHPFVDGYKDTRTNEIFYGPKPLEFNNIGGSYEYISSGKDPSPKDWETCKEGMSDYEMVILPKQWVVIYGFKDKSKNDTEYTITLDYDFFEKRQAKIKPQTTEIK
jgi:RHS repeat-associated protein